MQSNGLKGNCENKFFKTNFGFVRNLAGKWSASLLYDAQAMHEGIALQI